MMVVMVVMVLAKDGWGGGRAEWVGRHPQLAVAGTRPTERQFDQAAAQPEECL